MPVAQGVVAVAPDTAKKHSGLVPAAKRVFGTHIQAIARFKLWPSPKIASLTAAVLLLLVVSLGVNRHVVQSDNDAQAQGSTGDSLTAHSASSKVGSLAVDAAGTSKGTTSSSAVPFTPTGPTDRPDVVSLKNGTYDATHHSFTFDDLFLAQPVEVSEQVFPGGYDSTAQGLAKIAKSFQATTQLTTNNGTAYLSTNYQNVGKQIVVFSANGLLIFVQTVYEHPAADWPAYINEYN
jgi:hypothetical protein